MGVAIDDMETEMHRLEIVTYNGAMLSHMKTVEVSYVHFISDSPYLQQYHQHIILLLR
jgi:hypothetical protein